MKQLGLLLITRLISKGCTTGVHPTFQRFDAGLPKKIRQLTRRAHHRDAQFRSLAEA